MDLTPDNVSQRMPKSFKTRSDFRKWLEKHHESRSELVVRIFKVHASHRGIGYRQALDEALCWGWIDGVMRSLDADSFAQRFTPRKAKSNWSAVNIKRMKELISEGCVRPSGLAAFERRDKVAVAPYSFENRNFKLAPEFVKRLKANKKAWAHYQAAPPWYQRNTAFWVMQAKREETRQKRFASLLDWAAKELPIPTLTKTK